MTRIPITDTIIAKLKAHKERTGVGPTMLVRETELPGVKAETIYLWTNKKRKTANPKQLNAVLKAWESLPDLPPLANVSDLPYLNAPKPGKQFPKRNKRPPNIPIPPEFYHHLERTAIGQRALLRGLPPDCKLRASAFSRWTSGEVKRVPQDQLEAAMKALESLPDKPGTSPTQKKAPLLKKTEARVAITEELRKFIKHHRERTGLNPSDIMRSDRPAGLSASMVSSWINLKVRTASPEHVEYVRKAFETAPESRVKITKELSRLFLFNRERTGVAVVELLRNAPNRPKGLNATTVQSWLGRVPKTACKEYVDYVLELWASLPDKK